MQFHPISVSWAPSSLHERLECVLARTPPAPGHYPPLQPLPHPSDILAASPTTEILIPAFFEYDLYPLRPLAGKLYITDPVNQTLLPANGPLNLSHLLLLGRDAIVTEVERRRLPDDTGFSTQTAWVIAWFTVSPGLVSGLDRL